MEHTSVDSTRLLGSQRPWFCPNGVGTFPLMPTEQTSSQTAPKQTRYVGIGTQIPGGYQPYSIGMWKNRTAECREMDSRRNVAPPDSPKKRLNVLPMITYEYMPTVCITHASAASPSRANIFFASSVHFQVSAPGRLGRVFSSILVESIEKSPISMDIPER